MAFDPRLKIGQILKNADLVDTFKCGNMGGMRRSKTTNTFVLITDYTKGIYHDKWIGGVLHYTGMGKNQIPKSGALETAAPSRVDFREIRDPGFWLQKQKKTEYFEVVNLRMEPQKGYSGFF